MSALTVAHETLQTITLTINIKIMYCPEALAVVDSCIKATIQQVFNKLEEIKIVQVATRNAARQFANTGEHFVKLMSRDVTDPRIVDDREPLRISPDAWSKGNVLTEPKQIPIDPLKTSGKMGKSMNKSIARERASPQIINKEKLQQMQKLPEQQREAPTEMEIKLRKFYLSRFTSQQMEEDQKVRAAREEQRLKEKQSRLHKAERPFTFDYTGKVIHLSPKKDACLITQMKSTAPRKSSLAKKAEKKVSQIETLNLNQYYPSSLRHRKMSTQTSNDKPVPTFDLKPQFETICAPSKDFLNLKLSEFKSLTRRYQFRQFKHSTFETVSAKSRFPTVATMTPSNCSSLRQKEPRRRTRFLTEGIAESLKGVSPDRMVLNEEELYWELTE